MNKLADTFTSWHPALGGLIDWFDDNEVRLPQDEADYISRIVMQLHGALTRLDEANGHLRHSDPPHRAGRLEDMSPADSLELLREDDGDWIVTITKRDSIGTAIKLASVQFCTPGSGGGGSPRTWRTLALLALAMEGDDADEFAGNRKLSTTAH